MKSLFNNKFSVAYVLGVHPGRVGKDILGVLIIHPEEFQGKCFFINTVMAGGARDQIRHWLDTLGFQEWEDFICVA